jgi:arsenite methyltransferase
VRALRHFDYFAHSPSRETREVAGRFGARSIELAMRRASLSVPEQTGHNEEAT